MREGYSVLSSGELWSRVSEAQKLLSHFQQHHHPPGGWWRIESERPSWPEPSLSRETGFCPAVPMRQE